MTARQHPMPGQVTMLVPVLDGEEYVKDEPREITDDLDRANVLTSHVAGEDDLHRPVLDVDLPVTVLDSSTPGHHHLLIDKPMTWETYAELLVALANAGIVEGGYVDASLRRKHTTVRLPWVRKPGDDNPWAGRPTPSLAERCAAVRAPRPAPAPDPFDLEPAF